MASGGSMARDFQEMIRTYKTITEYNEQQIELVKGLSPYQKGDRVKLVKYLKYFPDVAVGSVATVCNVDWNKEYNYIISVTFDEIPKRYFWMPVYLFRSNDWENNGVVWTRQILGHTLKSENVNGKFLCTFSNKDKTLYEFEVKDLESGLDILENLWHSFLVANKSKL